jgi:hypothetical protein
MFWNTSKQLRVIFAYSESTKHFHHHTVVETADHEDLRGDPRVLCQNPKYGQIAKSVFFAQTID